MLGTAPGMLIIKITLLQYFALRIKLHNLVEFRIFSIKLDRRDMPMRSDILPVLQVASLGHALIAFVNGQYIGNTDKQLKLH